MTDADVELGPGAAEQERRTAPIELLWDLVFVFAVTRVTTLLGSDLSWPGLGRSLLVLALVWWAWAAFAWVTNAMDPEHSVFRGAMVLATLLIFITGLALPRAFGSEAVLFAVTYACVRLLHLVLYADAARQGNAKLSAIAGFAITVSIGMILLIAGAVAGGKWLIGLWIAAAAIDYAGPAWLTRERLRSLQRVAVAHFSERFGLFVLICLGESVVAIGVGAGRALTAGTVAAASFALLTTVGLWWVYFDRSATMAEEQLRKHDDPVIAAADAYSYLHVLLVAGIIVFAVGAREAAAHAASPLSTGARLALCGGAAAYLVGIVAFRWRLGARLTPIDGGLLATSAVCLGLMLGPDSFDAWASLGVLTAVFTALVGGVIAIEHRNRRKSLPSPPAITLETHA
jgi:low temperature requirement protein LtrA